MKIHGIEVDITLYSTEKESLQSDVRLRRNRRPKFQHYNSFQQVNNNLAVLRSDALFDKQFHIQDLVKCNYSQKMNARAQRARQNKKRNNSFGLTSQREITSQNRVQQQFDRQIAIYDKCPCSTRVYTIEMSSDAIAPKR